MLEEINLASLTHVCMWSENGWKPITAAKAASIHPGGTVSAHSGLFMCELCGQYVTLTNGSYNARHFRHSSKEKSKECPERTFAAGVYPTYGEVEHELPIKLYNITCSGFELAIGLIRVPNSLITSKLKIEIHPDMYSSHPFIYLRERLNSEGITYLPIGGSPSEKYGIVVYGSSNDIYNFWPKSVQGIDKGGTVFDGITGRRVVTDSDVVVGKKYYLLRKGSIGCRTNQHVAIREISRNNAWCLYEVMANDYDRESAIFFLNYHCRLTGSPITMTTVWPVSIDGPFIVKHNKTSVVMHLTGNVTTQQVFPRAKVGKYSCQDGVILEIFCNSRQQLISAGRSKALQYKYFWKEPINQTTEKPIVTVTDMNRNAYAEGEHSDIPDNGTLRILLPYDGLLNVKHKGIMIDKRKIHANTSTEISKIVWDMDLEVCIGLDCVWRACFRKKRNDLYVIKDNELLQRLCSYTGPQINVSHTIGSIATVLVEYPKVRKWIYKCIRLGQMNERAYRELLKIASKVESVGE